MKKRQVRTHRFRRGLYRIQEIDALMLGCCDQPGAGPDLVMMIPAGGSRQALCVAIHEALHASGCRDSLVDGEPDAAEQIGSLLWRLGWRREGAGE